MPERYYYTTDCSGGRCQPQVQFDSGPIYQEMRQQSRCYGGGCDTRPYYGQPQYQPQFETLDPQRYEQKTESVFTKARKITDSNSYRDNLFTAAEQQKPVVMVFGRSGDPNNGAVLDAVARVKQQTNGAAEFMYVDLDKVDPNSEVGKYAHTEIARKFGTPMVMVFNQKQGEGRTPVIPERPLYWKVGGAADEAGLTEGIRRASEIQKSYGPIKTGREKQPDAPPEPEKQQKPEPKKLSPAETLLEEANKPFKDQKLGDLFKSMKPAERVEACRKAIGFVDAQGDPIRSAQIRATIGLASIQWGHEAAKAGNKDIAEWDYLSGAEYIMSAGVLNRNLYKDVAFVQALRGSNLPGDTANFLIDKGLADSMRPADAKPWFSRTDDELQKLGLKSDAEWYQPILREHLRKTPAVKR